MYAPEIHCTYVPELPKLAWLATLDLETLRLEVLHGSAVEIGDGWIVEGVWDDEFAPGEFHRSDHFFGSGIRIDGEEVHFVPSSALVDRLLYAEQDGQLIVSNSLPLLLAGVGARLDPAHDYLQESRTILQGIRDYNREFRVQHPQLRAISQLYHDRLVVTREGSSFRSPPEPPHIESFDHYRELLRGVLRRIHGNYTAPERAHRVSAFTTVSSGYDSPAVSTLVREIGVRECFTSCRSRSLIPAFISRHAAVDDGTPVARALGMRVHALDLDRSHVSEDELYFLAASTVEAELVFHSMAKHIEVESEVAVVFSGYHGDKVWDVATHGRYLSDQIVRGDTSGLNLSEIRLKSGFIHVAVPFVFARHIQDIVAISNAPEMEPWRMHNKYDRPIPRRIVEEVGVPRQTFGMRKKAVTYYYNYPFHPELRKDFFRYVQQRLGWSSAPVYAYDRANRLAYPPLLFLHRTKKRLGLRSRAPHRITFWRDQDFFHDMHVWAVETLRDRLAGVLQRVEPAPATQLLP
ncbi:MAG: hypothetical protein H0X65_05585 [Gemmatimonadetes bacterium]|jgi:hypothetical protein|nr:hypothetical protein [Gemmatimonadota bacterium]